MMLVFGHQKGGVGKSTLAWLFAVTVHNIWKARRANKRVRILDCDLQHSCAFINNTRNKYVEQFGDDLSDVEVISVSSIDEFKKFIQEDDDSILQVIDLGGYDDGLVRLAIASSDLVVTPISDNYLELSGLTVFAEVISSVEEKMDVRPNVQVLFNDVSPHRRDFSEAIELVDALGEFNILDSIVRSRKDFPVSIRFGRSLEEYFPSAGELVEKRLMENGETYLTNERRKSILLEERGKSKTKGLRSVLEMRILTDELLRKLEEVA